MPNNASLGNGSLLVTLNEHGLMKDLYFPHVGMEDQTAYKHFHKIGIYDSDRQIISWLHEEEWQANMHYQGDSLVCITEITNNKMGIKLIFRDGVHMQENIFIRSIDLINMWEIDRNIKIFFHQDLHIYGDKLKDTALFAPEIKNPKKDGAIIHYRKRRYFLINGYTDKNGIDEFSIGKAHYKHLEGTWRDAEDGKLEGNAIDQGSVDSTIGFTHQINSKSQKKQYYWLCAGKNHHEVENLNEIVIKNGADHLLNTTQQYWTNWSNQKELGCVHISDRIEHLMKQSLLIIRTQIDNGGAIIAANDSDIMAFNKDTYTYMWPRDGALVAHALDTAGYLEVTRKFFRFCSKAITEEGYMLHKYNPDGSVGSSWHPWFRDGKPSLPIQEDETALILIALYHHYERFQDIEFIRPMYHDFIKPASKFLENFISKKTNLPKQSYDLWEEHIGIHTWTTSATISGLKAANKIAKLMGHPESAKRYQEKAEKMTKAMKKHLWNDHDKRFYKFIKEDEDGNITQRDNTVDASTMGVWLFEVLPANNHMVIQNNTAIKKHLWVPTETGGIARYQNDWYQRSEEGENIPGNPWIITTLWYAMWRIDQAKEYKDKFMKEASDLIQWATDKSTSTGILPEQLNFKTGEHTSVSPLTWSHATFVETILKYCHKLEEFGVCDKKTKE